MVSDSPGWPPTHYVCSSGWPPKPDTPASIFWMLRLHTRMTMPGYSVLRAERRAPHTLSKHFTDWVIAPDDLITFSFTISLYQNHNPKQPVFKRLFFNIYMNKDPLALSSFPSQAIISFLFEVFQGSLKSIWPWLRYSSTDKEMSGATTDPPFNFTQSVFAGSLKAQRAIGEGSL